ncbi:MAG: RNA polymerase sigma factor [Thermonemataceae bacterium]
MSTQYTDIHQHWIEGCRQGDRKAQKEIYRLYAKGMLNVSMRILNEMTEAEDVLQEAFVDMFKKIHTFKGESSFGAWFKRIIVNKSINQLKKRKTYQKMIAQYEPPEEVTTEANEVTSWRLERVQKGIQQLPDGFRTVLTLYLIEEYSHKEIAQTLGITESTSKSQLNRAKTKLRNWLKEH